MPIRFRKPSFCLGSTSGKVWFICQWFLLLTRALRCYMTPLRKILGPFCPALSKRALDQYFEMSVYVCVCVSPNSRPLIGRATGFWQFFWHPTYPTRCSELGWAVPHSDIFAWLSSATLKNLSQVFQVGFWCCKKQVWSTHRADWEDNLKIKTISKMKATIKMNSTSKIHTTSKIKMI